MKSLYLPDWDCFIRYYEITGDGPPIVYLAGLSFSIIGSMLPVASHPKLRHRHAILIDYLGSGLSDHPKNFSYTMDDHAKSIAAVLDNENAAGVTVVGHSMGGTVGIKLALQRPDLVANLIVGEGNLTSGGGAATRKISSYEKNEYVTEVFPRMRKERFDAAVEGDAFCNRLNSLWATVDPAGLHGNSAALVEIDDALQGQFFNLSMPRTFIYGERSLPENAGGVGPDAPDPEELKANRINVGIVPNAGHGQMFDNLDGFVDVLLNASA